MNNPETQLGCCNGVESLRNDCIINELALLQVGARVLSDGRIQYERLEAMQELYQKPMYLEEQQRCRARKTPEHAGIYRTQE